MTRRVIFYVAIVFAVVTLLVSGYYESNLREEVDLLRQQIREKVDAGQLMEARQLQDLLRDKITRRYGDGLELDHEAMVQERIKAHQEARIQSSRSRSYSGRNKKGNKNPSKFSDSRANHQMDQTNRKADILRNKINRGYSIFTSDEVAAFHARIEEYIKNEEKVAESLQATADDYNKARGMRDKESRLKHIEGAKVRKQQRHQKEYELREISRQLFFSLNDELDSRLAVLQEL